MDKETNTDLDVEVNTNVNTEIDTSLNASEVADAPEVGVDKQKTLLIGFVAVFAIIILVIAYVYVYKLEGLKKEVFTEQEMFKLNEKLINERFSSQNVDSTIEGLDGYIEELTAQIEDPEVFDTTKKILLVRKAIALSAARTNGVQQDNVTEATNILTSLYLSEPQNETERTVKNSTIPVLIDLFAASCYLPRISNELPSPYNEEYSKLRDEGHSRRASAILAIRDFAYNGLDSSFEDDLATVMPRAHLSALYLHAFGQKKTDENIAIFKELQSDVESYSNLVPRTLTGAMRSEVKPPVDYAYAYDIAHTHRQTSIDDDVNKEVDSNYEKAFVAINNEIFEIDDTSRAIYRIINSVFYLESIHRRYAESDIDKELANRLVDIFIDNVSLSKETKGLFAGYLIEGKTDFGAWMPVRRDFYEAAKNYPKLREFISELAGIDL